MAQVRAIVFDVGGTLLYPAAPVGETYAKFAYYYGGKLSAETTTAAFRAAFKSCSPRTRGRVPRDGNDRAWWRHVVRQSILPAILNAPAAFDLFFEDVYLYYAKPEAWGVYPEVPEVLEALRNHAVELVVLSNWDSRLNSVLDGLGLGEYVPKRFISAELGWEKPDPAIYRHVADVLRLPPSALLSVGDDSKNDIEAPRKAGWKTLQIERPKRDLWAVMRLLTCR